MGTLESELLREQPFSFVTGLKLGNHRSQSKMQNSNIRRFSKDQTNTRRTSRDHRESKSLHTTMGKFCRAVDQMDDTILVPTRLMGMAEKEELVDLYSLYAMLKSVKTELSVIPQEHQQIGKPTITRQMSTASAESCSDASMSDASSDCESEIDDTTHNAQKLFRYHLKGLYDVLNDMSNTAEHLTAKYQQEVGL